MLLFLQFFEQLIAQQLEPPKGDSTNFDLAQVIGGQLHLIMGAYKHSKAAGGVVCTGGFASLPIEAGTIREAWPFHVSADARKEEDAQLDEGMISRA